LECGAALPLLIIHRAFPQPECQTIESHRENIKHKLDLSCSRDLVACAKKYVEVTFVPQTNITSGSKKKVVRFPAA
jgi:hypothetical protein